MNKIIEIYRFRELLKNLVVNELKLRYRRSVLGFLWTMLNPLMMMVVLTVAMSTLLRFSMADFWVLLFAGMLPWTFLAQSVGLSLMSVVGKGNLLKKVYIPKALIPLSAVLACLINFLLSFIPLLLLLVIMGHEVNETLLFLPVAVILMTLFVCGVSFLFSMLNVFFRDFTHMTEVILQAWFFLSPIWYTPNMMPEQYRHLFYWNPIHYLIECFRNPIFHGTLPSLETVGIATSVAFGSFFLGLFVFLRFERHFVQRI